MNEHENLVLEGTENVEPATEEMGAEEIETPAKLYSEEEFQQRLNDAVGKRLARKEAKIRKEYEKKYGALENVLKAGTGLESVEEIEGNFRQFYEGKGIHIPTQASYSDKDTAILAKAEAEDIIHAGLEEVIEEVDRLAAKGAENMTAREKAVFTQLAAYRKDAEQAKELSKIGVPQEVYNSKEYKEFASMFDAHTPTSKVYELYTKTQPQKDYKLPGSMRKTPQDTGVKEFYSFEEAKRFTKADYDKTPGLFEAVERSMYKW